MITAIHQPNFFPWMGYFRKIAVSDVFVFLDEVQFPRSGSGSGCWVNRVKFLLNGEARWITCPVLNKSGKPPIKEIEICEVRKWRRKFIMSLKENYAGTPFLAKNMEYIVALVEKRHGFIADFNIDAITTIAELLNIKCRFVRQSELLPGSSEKLKGSELLAEICSAAGSDVYMAGDGSGAYEDVGVYERYGIAYKKSNFKHPEYEQRGMKDFVPGLSILDAVFNIGPAETAKLLKQEQN